MKTVRKVDNNIQILMSGLGWVEYNRKTIEQNKVLLKWDLEHKNINQAEYNKAISLLTRDSLKWYKADFEDGEFELMQGKEEEMFSLFSDEYEEEHGIVFNIFEIDEDYNEVKTIY